MRPLGGSVRQTSDGDVYTVVSSRRITQTLVNRRAQQQNRFPPQLDGDRRKLSFVTGQQSVCWCGRSYVYPVHRSDVTTLCCSDVVRVVPNSVCGIRESCIVRLTGSGAQLIDDSEQYCDRRFRGQPNDRDNLPSRFYEFQRSLRFSTGRWHRRVNSYKR